MMNEYDNYTQVMKVYNQWKKDQEEYLTACRVMVENTKDITRILKDKYTNRVSELAEERAEAQEHKIKMLQLMQNREVMIHTLLAYVSEEKLLRFNGQQEEVEHTVRDYGRIAVFTYNNVQIEAKEVHISKFVKLWGEEKVFEAVKNEIECRSTPKGANVVRFLWSHYRWLYQPVMNKCEGCTYLDDGLAIENGDRLCLYTDNQLQFDGYVEYARVGREDIYSVPEWCNYRRDG